ncbi:hypothetical protein TRIATDRAFT_89361 [Trichoderma atroviride IMI 206040]|uniref:Uncharacterized protein n=1 Tax=Hypocrea atroviridis (strain ATCC 20476 / IMI 206040) TaxID=452589 RepID=G9PB34_HYPAI|nr:uncharacterized protein TRIATDRAFT_89361 [Trichoderma atroviride IMI 206040]EHK40215.1 hypothetical protein TRIATDRAFT_89361 [Trichoderma atroviride IMI 206040]
MAAFSSERFSSIVAEINGALDEGQGQLKEVITSEKLEQDRYVDHILGALQSISGKVMDRTLSSKNMMWLSSRRSRGRAKGATLRRVASTSGANEEGRDAGGPAGNTNAVVPRAGPVRVEESQGQEKREEEATMYSAHGLEELVEEHRIWRSWQTNWPMGYVEILKQNQGGLLETLNGT